MVMEASLPLCCSSAATFRIPSASISNVTSIRGWPAGAGGIPCRLNWPRLLLSAAISRSPCTTCTVTTDWFACAVVNVFVSSAGIVVFSSISVSVRPPFTSTPSDNGATSSSRISSASPEILPAWMDAPIATASSGLTLWSGSMPVMSSTFSRTARTRVVPPTRMTSSSSLVETPASSSAFFVGCSVLSIRSCTRSSNLLRVSS